LIQEYLSVGYNAQNNSVDRCVRLSYVSRCWKLKVDVISSRLFPRGVLLLHTVECLGCAMYGRKITHLYP